MAVDLYTHLSAFHTFWLSSFLREVFEKPQ